LRFTSEYRAEVCSLWVPSSYAYVIIQVIMHTWRRKLVLCISYKMKYLQNETRKQKSVKEVTLQFSMIFQIRLKNINVNFRVICPLNSANTNVHTNMTIQQQNMHITESNNIAFSYNKLFHCSYSEKLHLKHVVFYVLGSSVS
jgi:hypothetical protein